MNTCPLYPLLYPQGPSEEVKRETGGGILDGWSDLDKNTVRWKDRETVGRSEGQCLRNKVMLIGGL